MSIVLNELKKLACFCKSCSVDTADKEIQVLRQLKQWWWQCCCILLHVDAVLTCVDSVDVNWNNSHVFVRAVLTVLTLQTVRDRLWDNRWCSHDNVSICCCMLMLCWLVLIVLTWIEKLPWFLWELCWRCCLCWLCWRCRQRETGFETTEASVMTVLLYVATCWCCVD